MIIKNILVTTLFMFIFTSCVIPLPIVGGGIAGGAIDPLWVRKSAENYRGFTSSRVIISHIANHKAATRNDRSDLFFRFPSRTTVPEASPTNFSGVSITYSQQNISIAKNRQIIIKEDIPTAFYYSDLQVASIDFQGTSYLLIATYSRASTGMVWIGFYRIDGTRLYTATLKKDDIWDVVPDSDGIIIAGRSNSTKITLTE